MNFTPKSFRNSDSDVMHTLGHLCDLQVSLGDLNLYSGLNYVEHLKNVPETYRKEEKNKLFRKVKNNYSKCLGLVQVDMQIIWYHQTYSKWNAKSFLGMICRSRERSEKKTIPSI